MEAFRDIQSLEYSKRRARLGLMMTAISSIVIPAVLIIILVSVPFSNPENPTVETQRIGRYYNENRTVSSGLIVVSVLLIVKSLFHCGLSFIYRGGLLTEDLHLSGTWFRSHAVWIAALVMCGAFLCYALLLAAPTASAAAATVVASALAAAAVGVASAVLVRRHLALVLPGPLWRICNMADPCYWCCYVDPWRSVQPVGPYDTHAGGVPIIVQGPPNQYTHAGGVPTTVQGPPNKHSHPDLV